MGAGANVTLVWVGANVTVNPRSHKMQEGRKKEEMKTKKNEEEEEEEQQGL